MKPTWRERKRCHEEAAGATEDEAATGGDGASALDVRDGDEAAVVDDSGFGSLPDTVKTKLRAMVANR